MIILSLICLIVGVGSAMASLFIADRCVVLETVGGILLLTGLGLVGVGLLLFR